WRAGGGRRSRLGARSPAGSPPGSGPCSSCLLSARADALGRHAKPVHARERGDVERPSVVVAPREVVRILRKAKHAEPLAVWRQNPDPAGPADVEPALDVDLDPVDRVLPGRVRQVAENLAVARLRVVAHHGLVVEIPVADVEPALVWREREAARTGEPVREER